MGGVMDRQIRLAVFVALALAVGSSPGRAQDAPPGSPGAPEGLPGQPAPAETPPPGKPTTPARLSYTDGNVSFWRSGAPDWAPARVNTPLAAGDQLYVGNGANLELQVGARSFLRAGSETQLAIDSQEPDYLQLGLTGGHLSLDLRSLPAGQTVEVDTPNAAFTVEHSGYYRIEAKDGSTTFISRRGGRASVTPAGGQSAAIAPSEEVVVSGGDAPQVATYVAPELDAWDRWNYERTDDQIDAVSSRYVSDGVYGADDLDQNGSWRLMPNYGSVWIPSAVPAGWAPYTTGRWILDPYYGWTWIDDAPWGWAPYHYGRWVHLPGYWAWAPGPVVVRPYYAPALVAFFSGGHSGGVDLSFGLGAPASVGWVALGWGEPCTPWWGPRGFVGHPHWFGWGGPRVAINETVVVKNINVYQNVGVPNALVTVRGDQFGRGVVAPLHVANPGRLAPVFGALPVKPNVASLVGGPERGARPPQALLDQRVVATREPARAPTLPGLPARTAATRPTPAARGPQLVPAPRQATAESESLRRPPFGQQAGPERQLPPPLPRYDDVKQREAAGRPEPTPGGRHYDMSPAQRAAAGRAAPPARAGREAFQAPAAAGPQGRAAGSSHKAQRTENAMLPNAREPSRGHEARDLPGEPANRVYRGPGAAAPAAQPMPARPGADARGAVPGRSHHERAAQASPQH